MGSTWKLTVVGGTENGSDFEFPDTADILVGRSRSASVRLTEGDVSGHHLIIRVVDGVPTVVNETHTSITLLNGREMASGESAALAEGDVVSLGKSGVRIRMDEVPTSPKAKFAIAEEVTVATRWTEGVSGTTVDGTLATRVPNAGETAALNTLATRIPNADETVALNTLATRFPDTDETVALEAAAADVGDRDSAALSTEAVDFGGDGETETNSSVPEEGKTVAAETQFAPQELMEELRRKLAKRNKKRRAFVTFAMFLFAAFLVALWFLSRSDNEADRMIFPLNASGKPDLATYVLRDTEGRALVEVDYPRNPKLNLVLSPDSNGVSVVSFMGRDRDVPFFLQLEEQRRPEELKIDLMSSVRVWFGRMGESGQGFVFDARMQDELKPQFLEDVYPGSCQTKSLYGVRFVQFEYQRARSDSNGDVWHGVAIYFRCGDAVYTLRREIPEFYWARGGYRLLADPNLAVYSNFIDSYWESPGVDSLPVEKNASELMDSVRASLSKERASDWRFVKKNLDAVLVKTWRSDPKTCDLARGCLRQFREVLSVYYWQKFNAYKNAMDNRQEKRALRFRQDAEMVFDDPSERYYYLIGNSEVW